MNKENIKATLQTAGWEDIKALLQEELGEEQKVTSIKTDGKSDEVIAREVEGKQSASRIIKRLLTRLDRIAKEPNAQDKPSYI